MGLSYSLFPPPAWTVWLQHALVFQRPIQFFKQGQEMLGVHLLCAASAATMRQARAMFCCCCK
jgi:hypothetical protein